MSKIIAKVFAINNMINFVFIISKNKGRIDMQPAEPKLTAYEKKLIYDYPNTVFINFKPTVKLFPAARLPLLFTMNGQKLSVKL